MRRVGLLIGFPEDDPQTKARVSAFRDELQKLGWSEGRNVQFDSRFSTSNSSALASIHAKELAELRPDVVLSLAPQFSAAMRAASRSTPIVFLGVPDPIGAGFVASLSRPGGNMTGILTYEEGITGKWLAMLKEVNPRLARVGLVGNPATTAFDYFLRTAKAEARLVDVEVVASPITTTADIEHTVRAFASANTGMIFPPDSSTILHSEIIVSLAARHQVPAVYPFRLFVTAGGLMSYGVDFVEMFKQAAPYVDRILRGAKPEELPVQAPIKFETALNLKAARALGITVPSTMLVRADEVIE